MATAALFCGMHFAPACSGRRWSRGSRSAARALQPAAPVCGRGGRLRGPRADRRRLRAHRGSGPRDVRRLDRLGGAGADPSRGDRDPRPGRAAARGQRAAQHRVHRRGRRRPGDRRHRRRRGRRRRPRCSPTRPRSWRSPRCSSSRGGSSCPNPRSRAPRWTERLRRGLGYVRERAGPAPPARRSGARLRLLRARDPDRGRVRQGDTRRRRCRLRRPAGELGRGHGRRQPHVRRAAARAAGGAAGGLDPGRSAPPTSAPRSRPRWPSPAPPRSSAGSATASSGSRS